MQQEGGFSGPSHEILAETTVRNAVHMWLQPSGTTIGKIDTVNQLASGDAILYQRYA